MRVLQGSWVPTMLAMLLHVMLAYVTMQSWGSEPPILHPTAKFEHIAATLVLRPKDVVAPKAAAPKPKPVPVAAKPPIDEFESARAEPIVTPTDDSPKYAKKVEDEKPKPKKKPKPKPKKAEEPKADPRALQRMREQANRIRAQQLAREESLNQPRQEEQSDSDPQDDRAATQSYIAMIQRVIQNNWNRPLSARNGMQTELLIQLIPNGDIVGVTVVATSGDAAFDRSAENAVKKAGRFPELSRLPRDVFDRNFRRLRFRFRPEDLRS